MSVYIIAAILLAAYIITWSITAGVSHADVLKLSDLRPPIDEDTFAWRIYSYSPNPTTANIKFTGSTVVILKGNVTVDGNTITGPTVVLTANPITKNALINHPSLADARWVAIDNAGSINVGGDQMMRLEYYQTLPISTVTVDDPTAVQLSNRLILREIHVGSSSCITLSAPFLITGMGRKKPFINGAQPPPDLMRNGFWGLLGMNRRFKVERNVYSMQVNSAGNRITGLTSTMRVYRIEPRY